MHNASGVCPIEARCKAALRCLAPPDAPRYTTPVFQPTPIIPANPEVDASELERMTTPGHRTPLALTKREFMQQYVLNSRRSGNAHPGAEESAGAALKAWNAIERECK